MKGDIQAHDDRAHDEVGDPVEGTPGEDLYARPIGALRALIAEVQKATDDASRISKTNKLLLRWDRSKLGDWEDAAAILARRETVRYTPERPLHLLFDLVLGRPGKVGKKRASEMAKALELLKPLHPKAVKDEVRRRSVRALAKPNAQVSEVTKKRSKKLKKSEKSGG